MTCRHDGSTQTSPTNQKQRMRNAYHRCVHNENMLRRHPFGFIGVKATLRPLSRLFHGQNAGGPMQAYLSFLEDKIIKEDEQQKWAVMRLHNLWQKLQGCDPRPGTVFIRISPADFQQHRVPVLYVAFPITWPM